MKTPLIFSAFFLPLLLATTAYAKFEATCECMVSTGYRAKTTVYIENGKVMGAGMAGYCSTLGGILSDTVVLEISNFKLSEVIADRAYSVDEFMNSLKSDVDVVGMRAEDQEGNKFLFLCRLK